MEFMTCNDRAVLSAIEADITSLAISCIVNAANEQLIMGGGVDGAIRRKAGPNMETELRRIGRCSTGQAVLTGGHRLPSRYVIHTVAPVWSDDSTARSSQISLLSDCYKNSLLLAQAHGIGEIAFPCLGTGIYAWPPELAARTAFDAVTTWLREHGQFSRVVFCCFSGADKNRYASLIDSLE